VLWVADLEADGLLDVATRIWCGVFRNQQTGEVRSFGPDEIVEMLEFMDTLPTLCMHNGVGYDWPLLRKLRGYEYPGHKVDTLLISRLQNPGRVKPVGCKGGPHSVEAWGMRLHRAKPGHEDWSKFSPEMMHRCQEDVEIQSRILEYLVAEGRGQDWKRASIMTHQLFDIFNLQEQYGWQFDNEYADKLVVELTRWINKIDAVLRDRLPFLLVKPTKTKGVYNYTKKPFVASGEYHANTKSFMEGAGLSLELREVGGPYTRISWQRVDLGSNSQTKQFLLDQGWIPRDWNFKDGKPTSPRMQHDDPFEGVQGSMGKLMAKRVQCRHRRSQISGWLRDQGEDGRLRQVITGIASTGRLKHSVVVNVPGGDSFYGKQMRKCFTSKPGYKIVGIDSAGCQNRMLAGRVGDPAFTKILLDGTKEDKTSIHYVNMASIKKHAGLDISYKISKNLNYAFMFGARDPKLASTAGVSVSQGALIRKGLLEVSPGFAKLVDDLTAEWQSTAKKEMRWGKVRYSNGIIKGLDGRPIMIEKEHTILVYMLQSDEAIMMQYALCFLTGWLDAKGWVYGKEYGYVANVHDEFQAEVREDLVEEYAALGCEAIKHAGHFLHIQCEHKGECEIGDNWFETH
jgi:DNA polymerase I